jgi:hypothetical protein
MTKRASSPSRRRRRDGMGGHVGEERRERQRSRHRSAGVHRVFVDFRLGLDVAARFPREGVAFQHRRSVPRMPR